MLHKIMQPCFESNQANISLRCLEITIHVNSIAGRVSFASNITIAKRIMFRVQLLSTV